MVKDRGGNFLPVFCQQVEHLLYQQERPPFDFLSRPYQVGSVIEALRSREVESHSSSLPAAKYLWKFLSVWCLLNNVYVCVNA